MMSMITGALRRTLGMPPLDKPKKEPEVEKAEEERKVRRVLIRQDTKIEFPELYLGIYVHGTEREQKRFAEMFVRAACFKASSPKQADLVIFAGSSDVNPDRKSVV